MDLRLLFAYYKFKVKLAQSLTQILKLLQLNLSGRFNTEILKVLQLNLSGRFNTVFSHESLLSGKISIYGLKYWIFIVL